MQPARRRLVGRREWSGSIRGIAVQNPKTRIPPGKHLRATNAHQGGLHPGYGTAH